MSIPIVKVKIKYEHDIVLARQRARLIAEILGFDKNEQAKIATAVSEISRNAYQYAGGGDVEFFLEKQNHERYLIIKISDKGPGIKNINEILNGNYRSKTGLGLGIIGAKKLMHLFRIDTIPGEGTTVWMGQALQSSSVEVTPEFALKVAEALEKIKPHDPFSEIQRQNQELLRTLDELKRKKEELEYANKMLEDNQRALKALLNELNEKNESLQRANELRAKFMSNLSHEFKTPLNSIIALSNLLLGETDGELTDEQRKQVKFIKKAAEDLSVMINDLLDLAKIDAGKISVYPSDFSVQNILSALRGMFKPMITNPEVKLIFDCDPELSIINSDEAKVTQILRNLISNAIKFTEKGEIRVSAFLSPDKQHAIFEVSDTGIGIPKEYHETIFEEFGQVEHPIQKKVKGTGLGLPLSRKFAILLGGTLTVQSEPGVGSTFRLTLPLSYMPKESTTGKTVAKPKEQAKKAEELPTVLVVEDCVELQHAYVIFLEKSGFKPIPVYRIREAEEVLKQIKPLAIILDILLPEEDGWGFITKLKSNPETSDIPIIVITVLDDMQTAFKLGADDFAIKPFSPKWLLNSLHKWGIKSKTSTILIADDEEVWRYLLRDALSEGGYNIIEAKNGVECLKLMRERKPDLVFLDIVMPEMDGFEVLTEMRSDPELENIPVVITTSKTLDEDEKEFINSRLMSILPKRTIDKNKVLAKIVEHLKDKILEKKANGGLR